ncbi:ABC transporter permease [Clostridium saccharobutylicum]|uniref:FtsX-like permease family protein n=1 Tax=Clostridium saccharobutylicum TaxID=169679 RepID=A0A1S8N4I8_CLOSA|nr:FtsX-like permease family protein [Clostridium saccharobutylicum]OOM11325.1 FtsX-like permease family protein [Clostridium saccharobutylicum]
MSSEEKKIIKLLIERKFKESKTRNKITTMAIAFTTMLFIISFTIGIAVLKIIKEKTFNVENITVDGIPLLTLIKLITIILIMFVGYMIIYNIYNVSLEKDVKFYGALKLIGATRKQIFKILYGQFYILSIAGIVIGNVAGFLLSSFIIPRIIVNFIPLFKVETSVNIYIYAVIFSFISSFISMLMPAIKLAQISPVKSVTYSADFPNENKNYKKSRNGGKIYRIAWSNLWRKNQKAVYTIICISISLMCLHSAYILIEGLSPQKYTDAMINSDFVIGTNRYFQDNWSFSGCMDINSDLSEMDLENNILHNIKNYKEFKEGGAIYLNADFPRKDKEIVNAALKTDKLQKKSDDESRFLLDNQVDGNGNYYIDLYGADDFPLSKLELIDGQLDLDKLKTGKYIIYALPADHANQGSEYSNKADYFNVGDNVNLLINNQECEYQIIAKVVLRKRTGIRFDDNRQFNFYLPSSEFLKKINKNIMISYLADAKAGNITSMENEIKKKSELENSNFEYQSKNVLLDKFWGEQNSSILLCVFLGIIFGMIGILNFVNSIISSIIDNSKEIAILKSIGMTSKQISKMIYFESIYFVFFAVLSSFLFIVFGDMIIGGLYANQKWFYTYKFDVFEVMPIYPLILFFSILLREISYMYVGKRNLAEELKR